MDVTRLLTVADDAFPFGLVRHVDFFAATHLAGHVRLAVVEFTAHPQLSIERIFAWIVHQGAWHYQPGWRDQIQEITLTVAEQRDLADAVDAAALDVLHSENIASRDFPRSEIDLEDCNAVYRIGGINLYTAGPTYMFCWSTRSQFGYLETHLES